MNALPRLLARRNAARWAALLGCGIVLAACAGGAALAVRLAFDGAGRAHASLELAAMLAGCGIAAALVAIVERRIAESLAQDHVERVRRMLVRAIFDREAGGDRDGGTGMLRFVGDLGAVRDWIANGAAVVPVAVGTLPIVIAALWSLAPTLAVPPALAALVAIFALAACGPRLEARQDDARRDRVRLARTMAAPLAQPGAYLLHDEERRLLRRLRRCSERIRASAVQRRGSAASGAGIGDAAMALAGGVVLWTGLAAIERGAFDRGTLAAAMTLVGFLGLSVHRLAAAWDRWHAVRVADHRLALHLARARRRAAPRDGSPLAEGPLGVKLDGVCMRSADAPIDVDIAAGEIVCLHFDQPADGERLLRIIAALQDPQAGTVRLADRALADAARADVRRAIAVVGPIGGPTSGSLRGHLRRAGRGSADARDTAAMVEPPAAARLPLRFDRRPALAPAELARAQLAIAAARGARIVLLQEPARTLDDISVAHLLRDARRRAVTVIAFGIDPRVAREADRILVLDGRGLHPVMKAAAIPGPGAQPLSHRP